MPGRASSAGTQLFWKDRLTDQETDSENFNFATRGEHDEGNKLVELGEILVETCWRAALILARVDQAIEVVSFTSLIKGYREIQEPADNQGVLSQF